MCIVLTILVTQLTPVRLTTSILSRYLSRFSDEEREIFVPLPDTVPVSLSVPGTGVNVHESREMIE